MKRIGALVLMVVLAGFMACDDSVPGPEPIPDIWRTEVIIPVDVLDIFDAPDIADIADAKDGRDVRDARDVFVARELPGVKDVLDVDDTVERDIVNDVDADADAKVETDVKIDAGPDVDLDVADSDLGDTDSGDVLDPDALGDIDADSGDGLDALDADDADAGPKIDTFIGAPFSGLDGLMDADLRAALLERVDEHISLGYSGDGTAREYMFAVLDVVEDRVECIYTGRTIAAEDANALPLGADEDLPAIDTTPNIDCRKPDGSPVSGGCIFNTEHSWPQSKGAKEEPARSDLHHLFPTYEVANSNRSNLPFGVTTCTGFSCSWDEGGSELGTTNEGYKAFEARLEMQGDVARAHFYFAVRYGMDISPEVEEDLRAWHVADPVDLKELTRNEGIFAMQGNLNPFVLRPDFVARIADF